MNEVTAGDSDTGRRTWLEIDQGRRATARIEPPAIHFFTGQPPVE